MSITLDELLFDYNNETLKPLLNFVPGASSKVTRKGDMIQHIKQALLSDDGLRRQWNQLSALEQAALAAAVHNPQTPGVLDSRAFKATHGKLPLRFAGEREYGFGYNQREPQRIAMFFSKLYEAPQELVSRLHAFVPAPEPHRVQTVDPLPATIAAKKWGKTREVTVALVETEEAVFRDLSALLSLVKAGQLKVGDKTGLPGLAAIKQLNGLLTVSDYYPLASDARADDAIRPFGFIMLSQLAKLTQPSGALLKLTTAGERWLKQSAPSDLRAAFERWLKATGYDELRRISNIKGQQARGQALTAPAGRRKAIVDALRGCPVGQWIPIEEFFKWVQISGNHFEVERGDHSRFYCFDSMYGYLNDASSDTYWRVVQAQYILVLLFEYLAAWGVVDVAYVGAGDKRFEVEWLYGYDDEDCFSRYDGLQFIRLTALGAYLIGQSDRYEARVKLHEPLWKVLPNQQVVITHRERATPHQRLTLERFSARVSEDVYQLAAEQLLELFESGLMSESEVVEFLQQHSETELPQVVTTLLTDVAERSRKVAEVGEATLFTVQDEALALQLAHDRVLKEFCQLMGATQLVTPSDKVKVFRRRVRELGYGVLAKWR